MLFTPHTHFFAIRLTWRFVAVTLTAHIIFGVVLGLYARSSALREAMLERSGRSRATIGRLRRNVLRRLRI